MHVVLFLNVFTTNVFAVVNSVTAALNVAQADDLDTTHAPLMHFYSEVVAGSQPDKNGWCCISEARAAVGLIAQAIAKNRM